ncbi:MAG: type II secretion system protein GspD [Gemmatimonadota bacterium]
MRVTLLLLALLLPASGLAQDTSRPPEGDGVTLDFQDVDIRAVITAIAEAGKFNVVYASLPPKQVTLRTSQPIPRSAMRGLLNSLAQSNGLTLIDEGPVVRVVIAADMPKPLPQAGSSSRAGESLDATPQPGLHVYRLKHARAVRIAATVQALFGGSLTYVPETQLSRQSLSMQLRANTIAPGYQQAPTAAPQQPGDRPGVQASIQIIPDESTNSLLVQANEADWNRITAAIEALDVRPLQVLIEVLIAEVRRSSDQNLGIALSVPEQPFDAVRGRSGGTMGQESAGDIVLRLLDVGPIDARVVLSALSSRADVSILSRPVILAHNNAEARILIGSERPFIQVVRALPTENAVRDQVIQYREVGTSLTILPTINPDGYVTLQLVQEVSAATNETQFGAPVISTREASTQLLVKDGQTAVIGGLIDRQHENVRSGVPLLKDIPILGRLFGATRRSRFNTELFLFITPRVVKSDEDVDTLRQGIEENTEMLKKPLRELKPLIPREPSKNDREE